MESEAPFNLVFDYFLINTGEQKSLAGGAVGRRVPASNLK